MSELNDSLDLAKKLQWAAPIENTTPTQEANLSSSYLSWDSSNAFLSNMSIDKQISQVTEMADETMQQAVDSGLITRQEDIEAQKQKEIAEAKAKAEAEAKLKAEIEAKEKEKARAERAEQFIQFLQWKSEKDKVLWYSRWVMTGILFSLCIFFLSTIFFKQQTIDFVSKDFNDYIQNDSIISVKWLDKAFHISENFKLTNNELANKIIKSEDISLLSQIVLSNYLAGSTIGNLLSIEAINIKSSLQPTHIDEEPKENVDIITTDESINESDNEPSIEPDITDATEKSQNSELSIKITYTNDESTANRVVAPNCAELSCGDYTKATNLDEIILCTKFRQVEDLADNDVRISKSWACRYKDNSELAFLDLNWDNELAEKNEDNIQEVGITTDNTDTPNEYESTEILE